MARQVEATAKQALENSILLWESYADDARKEKRLSHFGEAMSYAKVLRQLKQDLENESEDFMLQQRNKGSFDLKQVKLSKAEFEQLVEAIVQRIKPMLASTLDQAKKKEEEAKSMKRKLNPFYPENPRGSFSDAVFSTNGRTKK